MSLALWPVGPLDRLDRLDRLRKGRQMDAQPDGDTPERQAGRLAGWQTGRQAPERQAAGGQAAGGQAGKRASWQAGKLAGWQATVFAAIPLRNHAAPAEDLEQGA